MIERNQLQNQMRLRGFSSQTMKVYTYWNERFLAYTKKSARQITQVDVQDFLLHLADRKLESTSRHTATAALRFYYTIVLRRKFQWIYPKKKRHLPTVFSRDDLVRMIESTKNSKHRLLLELLYGSGIRVGEAIKMKTDAISISDRTALIKEGKGGKDRIVILSQRFIQDFVLCNSVRKDASPYLFPSDHGNPHISKRTAQLIVKQAAKRAGIKARIFPHALRSSCATHLLDNGIPLPHIQRLLGHARIETTQRYIGVTKRNILDMRSPLD